MTQTFDSPAGDRTFLFVDQEHDEDLERVRRLDGLKVMTGALVLLGLRRVKAARRELELAVLELEQARERACLARGRFLAALHDTERAAQHHARAQALREDA